MLKVNIYQYDFFFNEIHYNLDLYIDTDKETLCYELENCYKHKDIKIFDKTPPYIKFRILEGVSSVCFITIEEIKENTTKNLTTILDKIL